MKSLPLLLCLAVGVQPGSAAPAAPAGQPLPVQQPALQAEAERFARLWAAGDAGQLGALVARGGVRLQLDRGSRSPVPSRQATAALRDYFAGHREGSARLGRVSDVGGEPSRGFAEVIWHAAPAGATERTTVTVYVGFVQEGPASWRIDEIRVLPRE